MLDENLPAFFLKKSLDGVAHHRTVDLSYHGSDPAPAYTVQYPDPQSPSPTHKNSYAIALFDAYNPEVLFGEVLARPNWTQPTLSQEEIRRNGGIPPPPQPILPSEFTIQLYNPEQQVSVVMKEGKWGASDSWLFSLPEEVFRTPSTSVLDHGQSDPASLATTPRINFVWRKESKLNKELTCYMTGRSTDVSKKSSRKDPDIAIALWRQMRELTVYEPNLSRVELEDPKGLEVVLLLGAMVIKDLFFSGKEHLRELFNIADEPAAGKAGRKLSNPTKTGNPSPLLSMGRPIIGGGGGGGGSNSAPAIPLRGPSPNNASATRRDNLPRLQTSPSPTAPTLLPSSSSSRPPPPLPDPRAQWELDAETSRLKRQAEAEAREAARQRAAREKAEEQERRRLQKMVEEEERAAQKLIDLETERLRKLYGVKPIPQSQVQSAMMSGNSHNNRQRPAAGPSYLQPQRPFLGANGLYVNQPPPSSSASASNLLMSGANPSASGSGSGSASQQQRPAKKKSFFGLRSSSDEGPSEQRRLAKKGSSMW